jgi:transcriptional regulator ATRX
MLAELLVKFKDWIVQYHEHDSLLENKIEEELSEEERKAAWEEYEQEKKGLMLRQQPANSASIKSYIHWCFFL